MHCVQYQAASRNEAALRAPVRRCKIGATCCPCPKRRSLIVVQECSTMLRSERHVALNPRTPLPRQGVATMVPITSGGKSVNLARELLVTTMMLEPMVLRRRSIS